MIGCLNVFAEVCTCHSSGYGLEGIFQEELMSMLKVMTGVEVLEFAVRSSRSKHDFGHSYSVLDETYL